MAGVLCLLYSQRYTFVPNFPIVSGFLFGVVVVYKNKFLSAHFYLLLPVFYYLCHDNAFLRSDGVMWLFG